MDYAPEVVRIGPVQIREGTAASTRSVDAVVVEEDTWAVLGANPEFRPVFEHPIRAMAAALRAEPMRPGTVWATGSSPLRLHAVIYDLDRTPSCREEWIVSALREILEVVERLGIRTLALPLPGVRHARFDAGSSRRLLARILDERRPARLEEVRLL